MLKKAIIKSTVLVLLLVLKLEHRRKLYQGIYRDTDPPFDVVLLGSSHMHSGINPNVLWNKYGITSFDYGTGGQPINVTYYLLKEVLKKHTNPIVIVDLYYLGYTEAYGKSGYIRYVLDSMKTSMNKVKAVINTTPKSYWITYVFPFLRFHTRWKELNQEEAITTLRAAKYIDDYISLAQNKNYVLIALSDDYTSLSKDPALKESLSRFGLKLEAKTTEDYYMAVINSNRVESEEYGASKLSKTLTFENNLTLDATTSTSNNNMPGLVFNGKDYSNRYHGFNLVVYDKVIETVIDSVYLEDNYKIKR